MPVTLYIDNNAWDVFAEQQIDLDNELPRDEFRLLMTREGEFELDGMPPAKRQYVDRLILSGRIQTDVYFGFYVEGIPPHEQRVAGFGDGANPGVGGRFIEEREATLLARESDCVGPMKRPTGLFKNEADVSLAARSVNSAVLTCDASGALKRVRTGHGGLVIDLKKYAKGTSLAVFVRNELQELMGRATQRT